LATWVPPLQSGCHCCWVTFRNMTHGKRKESRVAMRSPACPSPAAAPGRPLPREPCTLLHVGSPRPGIPHKEVRPHQPGYANLGCLLPGRWLSSLPGKSYFPAPF
jgi:hypothetical protein